MGNDNCFSMKHYFLRNKQQQKQKRNPLEQLTQTHAFLFHSVYISEFKLHHIHPRNAYLIASYLEKKKRTLNVQMYETKNIPSQIVHLCALYYGGKYIEDDDNLDTVTALGLSDFIEQRMNETTLNRVWIKLDTDGSDAIDEDEIDRSLLLICMLFVTANVKESGCSGAPRIDKTELKELMRPISEWMKRDKMKKQEVITKDEFKSVFVEWLREYNDTNGGIIADEDMQNEMLEKYKMREENVENAEENKEYVEVKKKNGYDRLVINCEYLQEHKSMTDVYTKDDDYDEEKHGSILNPNAKPFTLMV